MNTTQRRLILKLLVFLIVPPLCGILGAGLVTGTYRRAELLAEADRELADHVTVLRTVLPRLAAGMEPGPLTELVEGLARYERVHGIALYDGACKAMVRSPDLSITPAALDALVCDGTRPRAEQHRVIRLGERELLLRAEPFGADPRLGALAVTYDLEAVRQIIEDGTRRLLFLGTLVVLFMAALALLAARRAGRGLGDLVQAAQRVASGDLSVRVTPVDFLEMQHLGEAFNQMLHSLDTAQRDLESAEARRRELERRLLHAQALRAVGQVAASLAHEVATPLSTILGWSRLSASDPTLPEPFRDQATVMADQCERITRIVQRLLAASRPAEFAREPVQLPEVAREVARFLSIECRSRSINLNLELQPDVPPILGERDRCFQLLINLCLNAIQAQPEGGLLVISVSAAPAPEAGAGAPRGVYIEVRDAGPGIPKEVHPVLFEPFYSTKGDGRGLGLPIAKDLVAELGGRIEVTDAPEGGACFRIFLLAEAERGR